MVYFIYGNQTSTIKSYIKKIAKEALPIIDEMNFVKFDGNNTLIQDFIDEANYVPLGYDNKVVAVENCYFLQKKKPRNKIESDQDYKTLFNYLRHPNEMADLILCVPTNDIDKTSELAKLIQEVAKTIEVKDPDQKTWNQYVNEKVMGIINKNPGYRIDRDALEELTVRTAGDIPLFKNSITKLFLYTDHIKYEDVCLLVTKPLEDNVYQMFNYLLNDKNELAVQLFRDLKVTNTEPVSLISTLAGQFRLLNQVIFLSKKGLNNDEIASALSIKPIRVQILKRNTYSISEKAIHKALLDLFDLDLQIKSGQVFDRYYAFELFLINFKRD